MSRKRTALGGGYNYDSTSIRLQFEHDVDPKIFHWGKTEG